MSPSGPEIEMDDGDKTVIRPSPGGRRPPETITQVRQSAGPGSTEIPQHAVEVAGGNALLVSAFSLLSLVPKLRNLPFHNAINELQERLIRELKNFENRAMEKGASRNQADIAKYLLCSLLDEAVLNTPWGSQSGWGHNSLSSLFYRKRVGGVEFFQILDRLKQQPSQNQDLLEFAYLCMSLGFEGKYRYTNNGLLSLERQRQDLYLLIQKVKGDPQSELSTRWRGVRNVTNPLMRHVPLWVLAGVAGVVLMIIYMVFAFTIRDKSDRVFGELYAIAQGIEKTTPMRLVQPLQVQSPSISLGNRFRRLLANEISQKMVEVVGDDKLRIFNMFQSGSADVRQNYRALLSKVAVELQKENVRALIVGHTDNQRLKFSSRFKSNWHLSMARAESAAKVLGEHGLPGERMRVEGKADKEAIVPNNTKANRAINRRIDIIIR